MMNENKTCPNCNHAVKPTWKICPYCKQRLQADSPNSDSTSTGSYGNSRNTEPAANIPEGKSRGMGFVATIIVALIVSVAVFIVMNGRKSSDENHYSNSDFGESADTKLYDSRDGREYRTVKIGDQTWMAENLNYSIDGSMCYDNDASNCSKYGRLYTRESAKTACPSGWHLPSMTDFEKLLATVGYVESDDGETASIHLRSKNDWPIQEVVFVGTHLAKTSQEGDDRYGFSVLPAGYYDSYGWFDNLGEDAFFWSSTEDDSHHAYYLDVDRFGAYVLNIVKDSGFSVRCLQD